MPNKEVELKALAMVIDAMSMVAEDPHAAIRLHQFATGSQLVAVFDSVA